MNEHELIMKQIKRFQELSVNPKTIFLKILKRTGLKYTDYSRALNKYPEYLNNRINKPESRPIALNDIFELKNVINILMPSLKFSDLLEESLLNIKYKNLTGTALHRYYEEKIKILENQLKDFEENCNCD